ncbi:MAG TPA: septum site-determining protein MinC [Limnochordia bacterium]|nr:septum site-determining protein MinC [Limnochordia bacterium]
MPADREAIVFKGNKADGISIVIDESVELDEVIAQLREKLGPAQRFFSGAQVRLRMGERSLDAKTREMLRQTIGEFGLELSDDEQVRKPVPLSPGAAPAGPHKSQQTQLIKRTLRSGQRIDFNGNIVVLGDVNPGAVITCTGDIVVLGALRGVAHAGCEGDATACVVALRLEPTQLRIAGFISRSPDGKAQGPEGPERALVREGVIQVESYVP